MEQDPIAWTNIQFKLKAWGFQLMDLSPAKTRDVQTADWFCQRIEHHSHAGVIWPLLIEGN